MKVIQTTNPDNGLVYGYRHLRETCLIEESRGGVVLVSPTPVTTIWQAPLNRVSLDPVRDANPFFHLYEAFWMLAGSNDGTLLDHFVSDFTERYGESGKRIHGAYGYRWREHFSIDQLLGVIARLREDPNSRQAVIAMWDPDSDFHGQWKDRPCNTHIYFRVNGTKLDMTVCCRSNDIYWGCYGANAVHFSVLLEYVANQLRLDMGIYYQISNNFHIYHSMQEKALKCELRRQFPPMTPLFPCTEYDIDCVVQRDFTHPPTSESVYRWIAPMIKAHDIRKTDPEKALSFLKPEESDWHLAGYNWIKRRMK